MNRKLIIQKCTELGVKEFTPVALNRCIVKLIGRLQENEGFPHEIGLFLGYPPEDVLGFIENKGEFFK